MLTDGDKQALRGSTELNSKDVVRCNDGNFAPNLPAYASQNHIVSIVSPFRTKVLVTC
jgi:hypothetical protein